MKDGYCKRAAAHVNQVRQRGFRKISVYSKVSVRPQHCCTHMRCNTTALDSTHRRTSASAHQHSRHGDICQPPPVVRREDDKVYRDGDARVTVHSNVSIPSIYNILMEQEKCNSTVGTKLDIIITGQEQYMSTVGNNLVPATAQQRQPILYLSLFTNGGVTSLHLQQQWYGVKRARNQTTSGLELDRGDVRCH